MSALEKILIYYAEGDLSKQDLLDFLDSVGATPASKEKILRRADYAKERHEHHKARKTKLTLAEWKEKIKASGITKYTLPHDDQKD